MIPGSIASGFNRTRGYNISRSLRFNPADSANLTRTPAGAGNRKTFTISAWVKRNRIGAVDQIFGIFTPGDNYLYFATANDISFQINSGTGFRRSLNLYRDTTAWYHVVAAVDTTQATASNRMRVYVNGVEISYDGASADVAQNTDTGINQAAIHYLGSAPSSYGSLYMTDVHFIDGQQLTPSSFGETSATTGAWNPKKYSGTYGTNGFYLNFSDNSNTTSGTLGKDRSGNGNDWTPNNFSVAAGAGNDSLTDTPTNYGSDTGVGGEVRGNFCTWSSLLPGPDSSTLSNGNLQVDCTNGDNRVGTFLMKSGKWYFEITVASAAAGNLQYLGVAPVQSVLTSAFNQSLAGCYLYAGDNGDKVSAGTHSAYGASFTTGDVIGVEFDADSGTLLFRKNGTSQGSAFTGISVGNGYVPFIVIDNGAVLHLNGGQRAFTGTPTSGFKALCTQNLADSTVKKPSTGFAAKLYTGTGSALSITGLNFSPDLVWIKSRSAATDNTVYDAQRGAQKRLETNQADAEVTSDGGVTAFNSDGFTLGTLAQVNTNTATYVAWCWEESATYGFDIVLYTGTGSAQAVNHSLGAAPGFITAKDRTNGSTSWRTYHSALGATKYLNLQNTDSVATSAIAWNNTTPTSSQFTVGTDLSTNTANFVAYLWAPIAGFSAFGSYVGNASTDGPVYNTGFRPGWVMLKNSTTGGEEWLIRDSVVNTYNPATAYVLANRADAESTIAYSIDFISQALKVRSSNTGTNGIGDTIVTCAFAADGGKYARAV